MTQLLAEDPILTDDGDEPAYRQEVHQLMSRCSQNNLESNLVMIAGLRRRTSFDPISTIIQGSAVHDMAILWRQHILGYFSRSSWKSSTFSQLWWHNSTDPSSVSSHLHWLSGLSLPQFRTGPDCNASLSLFRRSSAVTCPPSRTLATPGPKTKQTGSFLIPYSLPTAQGWDSGS